MGSRWIITLLDELDVNIYNNNIYTMLSVTLCILILILHLNYTRGLLGHLTQEAVALGQP